MASEGQTPSQATNATPLEDSLLVCPICLDDLKNAVATPCGHVHCEECLKGYIRLSEDPHEAECPTCRASFPIVTPDPSLIEPKYRSYINPPLRRVYVDSPQLESYQQRITELENRVHLLTNDKRALIQQCGSTQEEARAWQTKESNLRARCSQMLTQQQDEIMSLKAQLLRAHQAIRDLEHQPAPTPAIVQDPNTPYVSAIPIKRTSSDFTYADNAFAAHPNFNHLPQYAEPDNHKRQRMLSQASTSNSENFPINFAYRPESVGRIADGRQRVQSMSRSQPHPHPAPSATQYELPQIDPQEWVEEWQAFIPLPGPSSSHPSNHPGGNGTMG